MAIWKRGARQEEQRGGKDVKIKNGDIGVTREEGEGKVTGD